MSSLLLTSYLVSSRTRPVLPVAHRTLKSPCTLAALDLDELVFAALKAGGAVALIGLSERRGQVTQPRAVICLQHRQLQFGKLKSSPNCKVGLITTSWLSASTRAAGK